MHLRAWVYSTSNDGARSLANHRFLDGLLHRGFTAAVPGITISVEQTAEQGIPCVRLHFHLPQAYHSTGVRSIPVLIPTACVGTETFQPKLIFYALIEEAVGWLARVGPKNSLVRLYHNSRGQPLARSYSLDWQLLHRGFTLFISILRQSHSPFLGRGQISDSYGTIEVAQARIASREVSANILVTLTLSNRQRMSLFLPRSVARLPKDWLLDWLEVQNEFSPQVEWHRFPLLTLS
jgi:hypothetical protein